jgi:membrane-associated phospholipid phosphatase
LTTRFAQILSAVLHPLMMPTIIFAILFYLAPESIQNLELFNGSAKVGMLSLKMGLLILIFLQTFVLPVFSIYALYRFGFITDIKMETLADRRIPYLVTVAIYTFVAYFFTMKLQQFPEVSLIITGIAFSISAVAVISLYWKISAHAVGVSGMLGALIGTAIKYDSPFLFYPILGIILMAGFVMSARLHLNAHTPNQIMAGTGLGLTVSLLVVFFSDYFI